MRQFGFYWGITGVIGILLFAVYRITPKVVDMMGYQFSWLHWISLIVFVGLMAYAEGYKGFHRAFAPRVVVRANVLRSQLKPLLIILAPFFCMGYFHATRKRKIVSFSVTSAIILLVIMVSMMPQPWRGIIDTGVIVGLILGIASIVYFGIRLLTGAWSHSIPPDLPE